MIGEDEIREAVQHATEGAFKTGSGYTAGAHFVDRPGFVAVIIVGEEAELFRATLEGTKNVAQTMKKMRAT